MYVVALTKLSDCIFRCSGELSDCMRTQLVLITDSKFLQYNLPLSKYK